MSGLISEPLLQTELTDYIAVKAEVRLITGNVVYKPLLLHQKTSDKKSEVFSFTDAGVIVLFL